MDYSQFVNIMGYSSLPTGYAMTLLFLVVWSLVWKGIALWKAARNDAKIWYVVMLVVNTIGILEIVYIFFFSKKKSS